MMRGIVLVFSLIFLGVSLHAKGSIGALNYSSNGMLVQKKRLKIIAENVANVVTHRTDKGEPYRKKYAIIVPDETKGGVRMVGVGESQAPFGKILDPSHIFADEDGYLHLPNFELNDEMVNLSYTNVLYEANTTVFKSSKQMFQNTLELLK